MSIKSKILKGSIWNTISQIGTQGINIIVMIILAALLGPKAFGLVGMVIVIVGFLGYFTEFGLTPALIQKKDVDQLDYNTVYWSGVFLSILLYLIVFINAPLISLFYNEPELTLITRVIFIDFLIKPFGVVHRVFETKSLNYDKIAKSELASDFISGLMAIILAIFGYGVWSLVWQIVTRSLVFVIILMIQVKWHPQFMFSLKKCKAFFSIGVHFLANNLIRFFSENIDYLLIGKLLNPTALGIYTFSFRLSRYPLEKLSNIVGQIMFPAFASIQNDIERLRKNIIRISMASGLVIMPILVLLLFGVEPIIKILGKKWIESIPVMSSSIRILVIYIFILSISFSDESMMWVLKKVKTVNFIKFFSSIILLIIGYFAIKSFNVYGMALAYTIVSIIYTIIIKRIVLSSFGLNIWSFVKILRFLFYYILIIAILTGLYYLLAFNKINDILYMIGAISIIALIMIIINFKYQLVDFIKRDINIDRIIQEDSM